MPFRGYAIRRQSRAAPTALHRSFVDRLTQVPAIVALMDMLSAMSKPMDAVTAVRIGRVLACLLMAVGATAATVAAETRVALVIGNANYAESGLANPLRDANLIAETLRDVGFAVAVETDADKRAMEDAIIRFGDRLREAGAESIGFFYYAGHGVQSASGVNYLVPIDAGIARQAHYPVRAVSANWVQETLRDAGNRVNVLVLDACRNNPHGGTRGARGLAPMPRHTGLLTAFAARPGQIAEDGAGDNSPYAEALAKYIRVPGRTIPQVFQDVRAAVLQVTGGRQQPEETSQLVDDHYFVSGVDGGNRMLAIEEGLLAIGFNPGVVDGEFDEKTRAALSAFSRTRGAEASDDLDATLRALVVAKADGFRNFLGCRAATARRVVSTPKEVPRSRTRWVDAANRVDWRLDNACNPVILCPVVDAWGRPMPGYANYGPACDQACTSGIREWLRNYGLQRVYDIRSAGHDIKAALRSRCEHIAGQAGGRRSETVQSRLRDCSCPSGQMCHCDFAARCEYQRPEVTTVYETVMQEQTSIEDTEICECRAPTVALRECERAAG